MPYINLSFEKCFEEIDFLRDSGGLGLSWIGALKWVSHLNLDEFGKVGFLIIVETGLVRNSMKWNYYVSQMLLMSISIKLFPCF